MLGELSFWGWTGAVLVFSGGGVGGFLIARQYKDKRTLELEQQLEAATVKLSIFQKDVDQHFLKTSLLFNKLTDNYREVYEHLATGAQTLCKGQTLTTGLKLPSSTSLPVMAAAVSATEAPIEQLSRTVVETIDEPEASDTSSEALSNSETRASAEETTSTEAQTSTESTPDSSANNEPDPDQPQLNEHLNSASDAPEPTPAPEEITQAYEDDDEVHLGADSTPSVSAELERHTTGPSIH